MERSVFLCGCGGGERERVRVMGLGERKSDFEGFRGI